MLQARFCEEPKPSYFTLAYHAATMKQVTRASVDTAASHRKAQLLKLDPGSMVSYIMDDAVPRALIEVFKQDKLAALEFVESVDTVGRQDNMEDYKAAAM